MTSLQLKNKLGQTHLMDPKTDLFLKLPEGFRIFASSGRFWIGGHQDEGYYLHIERLGIEEQIPTILAEGDLDMYITSTGLQVEKVDSAVSGLKIAGSIGKTEVAGYLAKVDFSATQSYIVMVASESSENDQDRSIALDICKQIC